MKKIAVIGTGNMGAPMAINLAKADFTVLAHDIVMQKMTTLEQHGIQICPDHTSALSDADLCLTMLPTHTEVWSVFNDHLRQRANSGLIWIDSSTIDLNQSKALHQAAAEIGIAALDAPVSGGTVGAHNAALSFMVGGEAATLLTSTECLEAMGKSIVHCGTGGLGQAAKMCNNLMLGIQMASLAEGFRLAQQVRLSEETLFTVASASSGNCFALQTFCPIADLVPTAPSSHGFEPGFSAALMHKDMQLALTAAKSAHLNLPLAPLATSLYQQMLDQGEGHRDFSAVIDMLDKPS